MQNRAFSIAYLTIIIGGVISLVVSILMGVLLTRGIAIPLARMTSAMTALAKGDTTVEVPRSIARTRSVRWRPQAKFSKIT